MNMQKKWNNSFTGVLTLITFCFVAIKSAQASEPNYKGQPLSEWLLVLKLQQLSGNHEDQIPAGMEYPEDAIRQIGTNAIPVLVDILGATEENKSQVLAKLKSREFREQFLHRDMNLNDLRGVAVDAFGLLGTNAVLAIPQIDKLFHDWKTCLEAGQTLAELGPEGIATLTKGLTDENADIRGITLWVIGEKVPMDSNAVARLMIDYLKNPNDATRYLGGNSTAKQVKAMNMINRGEAAKYLGSKDPALAIPALLPLLDEATNFSIMVGVSRALSSYGMQAEIAIPKLLSIYTNHISDKGWSTELIWALKGIDTNAAAEAESFLLDNGPLNSTRSGYTTTLLSNGKELIVGGYIHTTIPVPASRLLSSAELLDPITGKWTETGEMHIPREAHTATLLRNGQVLITGGSDSKGSALSSAELYDPATEKWMETGSLNISRFYHTATLQPDGKVMVAKGHNGRDAIFSEELYDPATGKWTVITNK